MRYYSRNFLRKRLLIVPACPRPLLAHPNPAYPKPGAPTSQNPLQTKLDWAKGSPRSMRMGGAALAQLREYPPLCKHGGLALLACIALLARFTALR